MAQFQRGVVGKASVAASMSFGSYVLPGLVADFHTRYPQVHVSIRVTNPPAVTESVQSGECDSAFTILDESRPASDLDVECVMYERLVLVVSAGAAVAHDSLALDDLVMMPSVTAPSGTTRREIEDTALTRIGIKREHIRMEFGHAEAIKQAVRAGAGAAFLFLSSVRDELSVATLSVVGTPELGLRVPVYRIRRKGKHFSSFQTALMDDLVAALHVRETEFSMPLSESSDRAGFSSTSSGRK